MDNSEVGKLYTVAELRELTLPTVVCLKTAKYDFWVTSWLVDITATAVMLKATNVILLLRIRDDGAIVDNTGTVIEVAEYKGEV